MLRSGAADGGAPSHTFHPFSKKDEDDLVRVISTKPRHVLKHVRQLVWRSRKKELHFRNTVTQLMIVLQDFLRKEQIEPEHASAIMEGVLEECVKLSQHDMAHLLFRAFLRFRKYGCQITIDALRHLFESYKGTDSTELMNQLAQEMSYDFDLRAFCIAAYLFAGNIREADKLRAEVPISEMTPLDIVAIVEGYDSQGMRDKSFELLESLTELQCKGEDLLPIYKSIFRICFKRDDWEGMEAALELSTQQEVPLDQMVFSNILRLKMKHVRNVEEVAQVETDLRQRHGYVPDITGNSILISAYARLAHFGDKGSEEVMLAKVDTLVSSIEARLQQGEADMDITGAHLRAVIRGYGAAGKPELMKKAWPRLQAKGISDSTKVYNELIKWYALMGNVKDVLATKEEMEREHVQSDASTYSWALRALGKWYPRHVESLYDEILDRKIKVDLPLYTTLVGTFGDIGRMDMVAKLEEEVREREASGIVQVNPVYFAVLIRIHARNVKKVQELQEQCKERGYLEHEHVLTVLLHAYSISEEGRPLMKTLLNSLSDWSTETYNVLLNMYGKANDGDTVKKLLAKMRHEGVEMNEVTFGTLVTTFGRMRDTEKVKEIVELLKEKEGTVSSHFYSVLASTLSRAGDVQGVNDAWEDLLASKLVPDTEVYNQFLALYGKHHNVAKMQSVMETMMKQIPPNPVTATTVLDMLGKSGRIAEMEALFEDMKNSPDAQPTSVTYHQVLNAYAKSGDVGKMERLHDEMMALQIPESSVTFNILADGYGRAKRFEQLEDLLRRRAKKGVEMDELGYCVLVTSYGKVRALGEVTKLAASLRSQFAHLISRKVAWALVDAFCRCKEYTAMKEWAREVLALSETADKLSAEHRKQKRAERKKNAKLASEAAKADEEDEDDEGKEKDASAEKVESSPVEEEEVEDVSGTSVEAAKMALISYYCRAGLLDLVDQLQDEIENLHGSELSYTALNSLARGYASAGKFDRCVGILHQMRDRNLVPDSSTALALSSAFLKAGLHEQAQQIVQWRRQFAKASEEYNPDPSV